MNTVERIEVPVNGGKIFVEKNANPEFPGVCVCLELDSGDMLDLVLVEHSQYARKKLQEFADNYKENPEMIADYLQFSQRFYSYSPQNTRLIYQQNRNASFVKSYADWKKEGATVKKGEKGIAIWVPVQVTLLEIGDKEYISLREASESQKKDYREGKIKGVKKIRYKVGHVFDIAQTTYPIEQYPKLYDMGRFSEDKEKLVKLLETYCENELGCSVVREDFHSIFLRGYYYGNKIALNEKLKTTEELSTLTHEMGHAMGHAMAHNKENNQRQSTAQKEYEADCVSIVFQSYMGEEIPDGRKRHLAYNYQKYREELEQEHKNNKSEEPLEQFIDTRMEKNLLGFMLSSKKISQKCTSICMTKIMLNRGYKKLQKKRGRNLVCFRKRGWNRKFQSK